MGWSHRYVCTDIHRYSPIYIGCPSLVYLSWSHRWPKVLSTYTHGGCSTETSRYTRISRRARTEYIFIGTYRRISVQRVFLKVLSTYTHGGCSTEISRYTSISRFLLFHVWSLSVYARSPLTRHVTHTHTHTHTHTQPHNILLTPDGSEAKITGLF